MVGAADAVTVKLVVLVAVPPGVVTAIVPVVAPEGTVAVIFAALFTLKTAEVPWKATLVAPVKSVPVTVTVVPTGPAAGVKLVTVGAAGAVTTWGSEAAAAGRAWMAPTVAKTAMKTSEMSTPRRPACVGLPTVEG